MRVKIIVNPTSDQGRTIRHTDLIRGYASPYDMPDIVTTNYRGHGWELARQAINEGYDTVVAAGGDGTIHEVVNGIMIDGQAQAKLGVLPIGSGNDFAYSLNIPTNLETAVTHIYTGKPKPVDLALIEDDRGRREYFDNNFGFGLDAMVVINKETIKNVHGFLLYFVAALQAIIGAGDEPHAEIHFDDEIVRRNVALVTLSLGPRGGGGFLLTPYASHYDGLIDSCIGGDVSRLTLIKLLIMSVKGNHVDSPHVTIRQNKRITIQSDRPMPLHADGEIFAHPRDNVRQVTITSQPSVLPVIMNYEFMNKSLSTHS